MTSEVVNAWSESVVVIAVPTTGDWMILSKQTITLAFWFVDTNLWDVPIPTFVRLTVSGIDNSAFCAVSAILILLSSTFTANTLDGNLFVAPTPTNPLVVPIPIACVVPAPAWI